MLARVLARKWRPGSFVELIGQEHITQALTNALEAGRLHHAYLFCGTRGVGKTTVARILAKSLCCEQGVAANACNQCSVCQAIDAGSYADLIEVDAASRTKVEDTRELLGDMQFAPVSGRYKIYLIDEVHMLSNHSFNALLKTLEEPPPHVIFLFATTEVQKLPITVVSRCMKFSLKAISEQDIAAKLKEILPQEQIEFDEGSIGLLAHYAAGSMRDALSLTDQAIAYCDAKLEQGKLEQMLGIDGILPAAELLQHLADGRTDGILAVIAEMESKGADFVELWDRLMLGIHKLSLLQLGVTLDDADGYGGMTDSFSKEELQLFYQIALMTKRELPWAPSARSATEMGFIKLLTMQPLANLGGKQVPPRIAAAPVAAQQETQQEPAESDPAESEQQEPVIAEPTAEAAEPEQSVGTEEQEPVIAEPTAEAAEPEQSVEAEEQEPVTAEPTAEAAEPEQSVEAEEQEPVTAEPEQAAEQSPQPPAHDYTQAEDWANLVEELNLSGIAKSLLQDTRLAEIHGGIWILHCYAHTRERVTDEITDAIENALMMKLNQSISVEFEVGPAERTPAEIINELRQKMVENIKQEPIVNTMLNKFGGKIDEQSARPLE